jgi:hypothetical protein
MRTAVGKIMGKRRAGTAPLANHSSPRTTKVYDRRNDETSLDEYEKIGI